MDPEILAHYTDHYDESLRLSEVNRLELMRTQEILSRYLPPLPAVVLDVGGGPGAYSSWLAGLGYEVHLIDPVEIHVQQALDRNPQPASARVGDARRLDEADATADAVLLMGPLYHLTERADRLRALEEARRVLRQGGPVFVAAITRFASAIDALYSGAMDDERFREIVDQDLETGVHLNPTDDPRYFTTAYFHHADELVAEVEEAGFRGVEVLAVEGVAWAAADLEERLEDPAKREQVLNLLRRLEREPALMGASPHQLAVARKWSAGFAQRRRRKEQHDGDHQREHRQREGGVEHVAAGQDLLDDVDGVGEGHELG